MDMITGISHEFSQLTQGCNGIVARKQSLFSWNLLEIHPMHACLVHPRGNRRGSRVRTLGRIISQLPLPPTRHYTPPHPCMHAPPRQRAV